MDRIYLELSKFKTVLQLRVSDKINYIKTIGMTQKESKILEITNFVKNLVSFFKSLIYVVLILVLGIFLKFSLLIYYKINEISSMLSSGYFIFIQQLKAMGILFTQSTFEIVYFIYWSIILLLMMIITILLFYIIYNILKFLIYGLNWLDTQRKELTQYGINLIEKESKLEEKNSKYNYLGTFDCPLINEDENKNKLNKSKKMLKNKLLKLIDYINRNRYNILLVILNIIICIICFILLNKIIFLGFKLKGIKSMISYIKSPEDRLLEELNKLLKDKNFVSFLVFSITAYCVFLLFVNMYGDQIISFRDQLKLFNDFMSFKAYMELHEEDFKSLSEYEQFQKFKEYKKIKNFHETLNK
jgi:hypothetical protein